jgi:hypothetical protein
MLLETGTANTSWFLLASPLLPLETQEAQFPTINLYLIFYLYA